MGISIFKGRQLSQSNLLTCRYTVGGGMLGGFNSATIRKNNDGTVNYITESAQTHADRIVTKTYVASDEDLKMIKELFIKYNIASMSKKRLSPFQVLDGDTRTISFMFDNLETFNVSDNQDLSKEDMEKFLDITKALSELAKGEAIVEI